MDRPFAALSLETARIRTKLSIFGVQGAYSTDPRARCAPISTVTLTCAHFGLTAIFSWAKWLPLPMSTPGDSQLVGDLHVGDFTEDRDIESHPSEANVVDHCDIQGMLADYVDLTHVDVARDLQICGLQCQGIGLLNARVSGDIVVKRIALDAGNAGDSALLAENLRVRGRVTFGPRIVIQGGGISLRDSRVENDVRLGGVEVRGPFIRGIDLSCMTIDGDLDVGVRPDKVSVIHANSGPPVGSNLASGDYASLCLRRTTVAGDVRLLRLDLSHPQCAMDLERITCQELEIGASVLRQGDVILERGNVSVFSDGDLADCQTGCYRVTGFEYQQVWPPSKPVVERINWLKDEGDAAEFSAESYGLQTSYRTLANAYRSMGLFDEEKDVRIELDGKSSLSKVPPLRWLQYGRAPYRIVIALLGLIVCSALVAFIGYSLDVLVSADASLSMAVGGWDAVRYGIESTLAIGGMSENQGWVGTGWVPWMLLGIRMLVWLLIGFSAVTVGRWLPRQET